MNLINNIYNMLSYAFETLNNKSYSKCSTENYSNITDLFASILIKGIKSQLKRGLIREYNNTDDVTHNIRGKIDIQNSINANYTISQKLACSYDDLTINSKPNQILKATLKLLNKSNISSKTRRDINSILIIFDTVHDINVKNINWNIHFNSSNKTYKMLITICNLTVYGLENSTQENMIENFFDEESMGILFKQFTIEYYKRNYKLYRMLSPKIEWNISGAANEHDYNQSRYNTKSYSVSSENLPVLQANMVISNYEKKLIVLINYNATIIEEIDILRLYSMVKNADTNNTGDVSGVLVYGGTNDMIQNQEFLMGNNKIVVKYLDLNSDFNKIKAGLDSIISTIK